MKQVFLVIDRKFLKITWSELANLIKIYLEMTEKLHLNMSLRPKFLSEKINPR